MFSWTVQPIESEPPTWSASSPALMKPDDMKNSVASCTRNRTHRATACIDDVQTAGGTEVRVLRPHQAVAEILVLFVIVIVVVIVVVVRLVGGVFEVGVQIGVTVTLVLVLVEVLVEGVAEFVGLFVVSLGFGLGFGLRFGLLVEFVVEFVLELRESRMGVSHRCCQAQREQDAEAAEYGLHRCSYGVFPMASPGAL